MINKLDFAGVNGCGAVCVDEQNEISWQRLVRERNIFN
jgi:hypothetical protein